MSRSRHDVKVRPNPLLYTPLSTAAEMPVSTKNAINLSGILKKKKKIDELLVILLSVFFMTADMGGYFVRLISWISESKSSKLEVSFSSYKLKYKHSVLQNRS